MGEHNYQELMALKISDRVYEAIYNTDEFQKLSAASSISKDVAQPIAETIEEAKSQREIAQAKTKAFVQNLLSGRSKTNNADINI